MNSKWEKLKEDLPVGSLVAGKIIKHCPFGFFLELNGIEFLGLIQITDFKRSEVMTTEEFPQIGIVVRAKVLGFKETGQQVWLKFLGTMDGY